MPLLNELELELENAKKSLTIRLIEKVLVDFGCF